LALIISEQLVILLD